MLNPLNDQRFLDKLFEYNNRQTYIKIIALTQDNKPIEKIEGLIQAGSINIDGQSAIRRSCNLTMLADKQSNYINDQNWFMSTKIVIYIGLYNFIDPVNYDNIIWFPMGYYYISSFNYSLSLTHYTITLSAKDKMCMLNGELGGVFTALTTDVGQEELTDKDGNVTIVKRKIKDIIRDLVHCYGNEPYYNIIINDLDLEGQELLEYRGSEYLYLLKKRITNEITLWTTDGDYYIAKKDKTFNFVKISDNSISYEKINQLNILDKTPDTIYLTEIDEETGERKVASEEDEYTIIRLGTGEIAGYRATDLVYSGDLIANLGETVVSVLDKIKNMLGVYEYFYNIDGQFVFQKKPSELQTTFTNLREDINNDLIYIEPLAYSQNRAYVFNNYKNVVNMSNNLNLSALKNDYSVWGVQNNIPIHMRYSIKKKPKVYINYEGDEFNSEHYDWREILYQMAKDDKKRTEKCNICNSCQEKFDLFLTECPICQSSSFVSNQLRYPDFREKIMLHNDFCINGQTGYETYYADMLAFWRELYNPNPDPLYKQISYAAPKSIYPTRFVDQICAIGKQEDINNRDNLCLLKDGELLALMDTIDFTTLDGDSDTLKISIGAEQNPVNALENIYYYYHNKPVKIIDSLSYDLSNLYGLNKNGQYVLLYKLLTEEIYDNIYISATELGFKQKYHNYYTVAEYKSKNIQFPFVDNQFYYTKQDANKTFVHVPIYEIYLKLPTGDNACLWQYYPNVVLSEEMTTIIESAIKQYPNSILLKVQGQTSLVSLNTELGESITVNTLLNADQYYLWYKENTGNTYVPLQDKILVYSDTTETNKFNKYKLYKYIEGKYINTVDLIDIDKTAAYWGFIEDDNNPIFFRILDQLIINDCNNLYEITNNKIDTKDVNPNLQFLYMQNSEYLQSFSRTALNIKGLPYDFTKDSTAILIKYYDRYYEYQLAKPDNDYRHCWKNSLYNDFTTAKFWIDFLDVSTNLNNFSVDKIGARTKTENNNTITAINFGDIPSYQWVDESEWDTHEKIAGYTYIKVPKTLYEYFVVTKQGKSCKETIDAWLTNYAKINESINLNCIPIYSLQPNTIIVLNQQEYEISRITIPLSYNGMMAIQATKILRQSY